MLATVKAKRACWVSMGGTAFASNDSNAQLTDPRRMQPPNVSYRPTSNPLTAHDAGTTATINIASFTMRCAGVDISENSGSITGLSYNTLYYIYFDDQYFQGGGVSYNSTTTKETALNGQGRFFVGSIQTPRSGYADTTGNGDGGTGGQYGMQNVLHPTAYLTVNAGTNISNAYQAVDGDLNTFAQVIGGTNVILRAISFPNMVRGYQTATLKVVYSITANTIGAGQSAASIVGSILGADGNLYNFFDGTSLQVNYTGGQTVGITTSSVAIPPGTNFWQVQASVIANPNGNTGSVTIKFYEAYIVAQE